MVTAAAANEPLSQSTVTGRSLEVNKGTPNSSEPTCWRQAQLRARWRQQRPATGCDELRLVGPQPQR
jgi:hypothetical protein